MQQQNPESGWFGFKKINPEDKQGMVRDVFASVAPNYDLMNDAMSLGIHRLWKDIFVRHVRPRPGQVIIDLAGGTGDIAMRMARKTSRLADITLCDINPNMLSEGRDRALNNGFGGAFQWTCGNAESLPFADDYADQITIAYGLRNVTRIDQALNEAKRVLKPGGRFHCLEFSHVDHPVLKKAYDAYSYAVLPKLGRILAGDADSYHYLAESIRQFPERDALCQRMEKAGFEAVSVRSLSQGITAIHSGTA